MKEFLKNLLRSRVTGERWEWFEQAIQAAEPPAELSKVLKYYTGASRRVGKQSLMLDDSEQARLAALNVSLILDHWGADEAGRLVLLLSAAHLPKESYQTLVQDCYEQGDSREQQSWLRALCLIPNCERYLETAIDACRTNIIDIFESIACENPYPLLYFPEPNFNQLVLKGLFNGIAMARIVGLESRLNVELSRMADDYVSEREAAGREVPVDIWLVLAPFVDGAGLSRVHSYLRHDNATHRYWAAFGLGLSNNAANRRALQESREAENEVQIREAIDTALVKLS